MDNRVTMGQTGKHRRRLMLAILVGIASGMLFLVGLENAPAQDQSGLVVSQAKHTSPYDAFMKINRFREEQAKDEEASEYWGFLQNRLANQAGRNLIKRPVEGFSEKAFFGWMIFMRAYGDNTRIGNCAACHRASQFTDGKPHNIGTGKDIVPPSLRDLHKKKSFFKDGSVKTLEEAIKIHVENGRIARQRKTELVDIDLGLIALTDDEIKLVAEFLRSLKTVDRKKFRKHLINVEVQLLDVEDFD